jgi:hypothetical protein
MFYLFNRKGIPRRIVLLLRRISSTDDNNPLLDVVVVVRNTPDFPVRAFLPENCY